MAAIQLAHRTPPILDLTPDVHTLAGEHALLLLDVRRRVRPIHALLERRVWPDAELYTLLAFLRATVLRHVADEEALLYPTDSSTPPFAQLGADHVRLHVLTAQLQRAGEEHWPLPQVRDLVDDLLAVLERHLADEEAALATLPGVPAEVPSAAELPARGSARPTPNGQSVLVTLDALSAEQPVHGCIERLLRLRPGQSAEIHASDREQLTRVGHWLHNFDAGVYDLEDAPGGGGALRVTCRPD